MIALDTNVIVRIVTADDPKQLTAALEVFRSGDLWLCKTVLLETEWVLRYSYQLPHEAILEAFQRLLGYRPLQVEDRATVLLALHLFGKGMDFADALHLASSSGAEGFATFDRALARIAKHSGLEGLPSVELIRTTA